MPDPAQGDAPHVGGCVEVRHPRLRRVVRVVGRRRNRAEQYLEQGLEVGAGHRRIERRGAGAGVGVDDREVDLLVGGVEVEEQLVHLVDDRGDAGVGPVDLVDDHDDGQVEGECLAQHEAGLGERSLAGVDEQEHAVDHGERPFDLAPEVGVARRVDDVQLDPTVAHRRVLGEDRDPLLALEVHGVHHPLRDAFVGAERAGLPEHGVDEGRLAMVDVGDDRHVAEVVPGGHEGGTVAVDLPGSSADPGRVVSIRAASMDDHELAGYLAARTGDLLRRIRDEGFAARVSPWILQDRGDLQAHELIVAALAHHRPADAVLSEEGTDDLRRLEAERVWIVDPLDGTRDYGDPHSVEWAVHIALVVDGVPAAAAVACPGIGRLYGTLVSPVEPTVERDEPVVITSRSSSYYAHDVADALGGRVTMCGSAGFKAMAVVSGAADVYVHPSGFYEWDVCAPAAVAAAAGLDVSSLDGNRIVYNKARPVVSGLVISRPELTETALDAIG